ncbi:hypothetical protein QUA56_35185 [Microcoleus sp. N3A4]|uniref:hypothetical protein n=1 Tax=Microcoleus sp. N3A4 TaxID=3055379 RepID=UPI002FD31989
MATDKKHIAVYLAPEVEQALIAFCQEKALISKKGTMFSAGVNAALAEFFGTASEATVTGKGNIPQSRGNILTNVSNIPNSIGSIPEKVASNIPFDSFAGEELPGKLRA